MTKSLLAGATALSLMAGAALAQQTYDTTVSRTTTTTVPVEQSQATTRVEKTYDPYTGLTSERTVTTRSDPVATITTTTVPNPYSPTGTTTYTNVTPSSQQQTTTMEQMTIIAPHVQHRTIERSYTGVPVEELSLSRVVDYSDLDLSRWTDVQRLDHRIRRAAHATCNQLDREYPQTLYPSYQSSDLSCVTKATDEGMAQARLVVAQANGYPPFAE